MWISTPFPFQVPKGFPRLFTGLIIIHEPGRDLNWAGNYFTMESFPGTEISPVHPVISSLLPLRRMNTA